MKKPFDLEEKNSRDFLENYSVSCYTIFVFDGKGKLIIDFVEYHFSGKTILFTSPFQHVQIISEDNFKIRTLGFHSDFYCIEYHKNEVACNGLLFNNIYLFPQFNLDDITYEEISDIYEKIKSINLSEEFSDAVLKTYLQLILAISSREKVKLLHEKEFNIEEFSEVKTFQNLVEENFIKERSPSFYADLLHISSQALSKRIKNEFGKTPSQIIQERVILEAKKQIHLTKKSIKEIAAELNFEDEYYFSKYFKKHTGTSPTRFREEVGISIVAK